jgi:hypothetical protein
VVNVLAVLICGHLDVIPRLKIADLRVAAGTPDVFRRSASGNRCNRLIVGFDDDVLVLDLS